LDTNFSNPLSTTMGGVLTQLFPPVPTLTEKNLPDLEGKVFIVTGGNAGIGLELVKILYSRAGTVYVAGRSSQKITSAINEIKKEYDRGILKGQLKSLIIDLSDLTTIAEAASSFLAQETRLDVLFNNAGIAQVPAGSMSKQHHEAHMGTNCLGPFLFTKLLLPVLTSTAKSSPKGCVRVIFTSSSIVDFSARPGGLAIEELKPGNYSKDKARNYASSKTGNWFLASEFDRRLRGEGITCVTQNPGNLKTESWNGVPVLKMLFRPLLYEPRFGAYTELWCGLSDEVKTEDGGRYAVPWGRWHAAPRKDILASLKAKDEGGTGLAGQFWEWCEEETRPYANI
jgi:NAD(P)-dependent dehydrogenase (short-subunit alcohol dehydrogenase family)